MTDARPLTGAQGKTSDIVWHCRPREVFQARRQSYSRKNKLFSANFTFSRLCRVQDYAEYDALRRQ